jgi:hypothetical protein
MIQCARLAFGYGGIFDPDEAEGETGTEFNGDTIDGNTGEVVKPKAAKAPEKPAVPDSYFASRKTKWQQSVDTGKSPEELLNIMASKYTVSDAQRAEILAMKPTPKPEPPKPAPEISGDEMAAFVGEMEAAEALPL